MSNNRTTVQGRGGPVPSDRRSAPSDRRPVAHAPEPPAELPEIADPLTVSTTDARSLSTALFERLRSLEEGTADYSYVRNTLVELNLSLVKYAATRFRRCHESWEDIVQVGTVGLIKAINRFDPERGNEFMSFALPTVLGEIRRHLRDTSWSVHVPRRLQELRLNLAKASDALEQELGRPPTDAELGAHLQITAAELREGRLASNGFTSRSLDVPVDDEDGGPGLLARSLGSDDDAFEKIENLEALKPLIADLSARDRTILALRFGDELTQAEIGRRLGLSQMHVSRLLSGILGELRTALTAEEPPEAPPTDTSPTTTTVPAPDRSAR
ncbi:SigB/SigF/SigG family RNA polymerase sigma factor [Streptomyces sp. TX20-6-3]|uniref:SigB/SigF/SigG family RNA polymerase sigma factor n=1 Tax=Streptomyces sp. TX20-6-3 TaxID=3028705 RepID=UPI0029A6BC95|nr:SigB/SigF/SigG family RNA polymerase sigma factor [Streptomyces sp. TX20-6-3]MDX2560798.1 SigB/SigF/SigG family RNA polymerase sigma factor [Streptomyces sp. TX20-6-3]